MKFKKLKLAAAAAVLAVSGAASAAIDSGNAGNGELFFTAWDGANSYTFDLNVTLDAFLTNVGTAGAPAGGVYLNSTLDALFDTYFSTANPATLLWNIVANDNSGARRLISSYSSLPTNAVGADQIRSATTAAVSFVTAVNTGIAAQGNGNSAVFAINTPGYAANTTGIRFGTNNGGSALYSINNSGTNANNSYATGLGLAFITGAASGIAPGAFTPMTDEGSALRAYLDTSTGNLTISAVPEPETYAMLLAGLGLMGAIARRRRNKA
jgi:PEP-CTERM motif